MKLLALDCSTEACSVALFDGDELLERFEIAARTHTQRLLPLVDDVLAQGQIGLGQLDGIAFGRGPGSFTGIRICLAAVQGLAFGADLPVVPVSTLAAQAQTALLPLQGHDGPVPDKLLSTLDARMDEIYWALYDVVDGAVQIDGKEHLSAPEQLILPPGCGIDSRLLAVGSGWGYADRLPCKDLPATVNAELLPRAAAVGRLALREFQLGLALPAEKALPVYLRDEVAWKKQV